MKELIPAVWDDVEFARDGSRVQAHGTVSLGWMGVWRELDLTGEHTVALRELIEPWFEAGHRPDSTPRPQASAAAAGRRPDSYYAGLRDWAARRGLKIAEDSHGKKNYTPLKRKYDEYLAKQGESPDGNDH